MKKIVLIFATILILFPATIKAKDNEYIYYKHASTETKKYIYFNDYNSDYSSATIQMTDDIVLTYIVIPNLLILLVYYKRKLIPT